MERVLVVGGAGFVGSNLVKYLLKEYSSIEVVIIDNMLSAHPCNIPGDSRVTFIEGSIADDAILDRVDDSFDYIFHLACYHGNQSSIANPLADHENNTLTTLKLFEKIKDFSHLKKVVYSAAGCSVAEKTYDAAKATEEVEKVSLDMDSPYSMSKVFGEFYSRYYFRQHALSVVRARFQNVYGPGEILGAGQWRGTPATIWRNVVPTFIYKSLTDNALPLENGGEASRDFIFVEDIVRGLVACALKGEPGDVYNLATACETTILELAEKINELTGNEVPCDILPRRSWDNSGRRFGSTAKATNSLGFTAEVGIDEGLARTVSWTQENFELITETMQRHEACV